jgi:hypothetical protein
MRKNSSNNLNAESREILGNYKGRKIRLRETLKIAAVKQQKGMPHAK